MLLHRQGCQGKNAVHPLTGEGRGEQHRCPVEEIQLGAELLLHGGHGVTVLLHRIPFVHHHHTGATVLLDPPRQALILFGDAIKGIDHQHADVTAINRFETAVDAEEFRSVVNTPPPADSSCVDQPPGAILANDIGVNGVPGGAANRAHDRPLFTTDGIEQTGFADVRSSDDCHLDRLFLFPLLVFGRKKGQHLIQQIPGTDTMDG